MLLLQKSAVELAFEGAHFVEELLVVIFGSPFLVGETLLDLVSLLAQLVEGGVLRLHAPILYSMSRSCRSISARD